VKRDDCTLSPADLESVRCHADRLLREADAIGRLPTPVADLVAAARLEVARDVSLDQGFLGRLYRKVTAPIRRAIDKVLGLLDRRDRTIYLDQTVHKNKEPFLCLHETGHEFLPWQRDTFSLLEDCQQTLDPEVQDHFEREANVFACEVLFQLGRFEEEARDCPFGLRTPLDLARRYGSSCYAAVRRYVATNRRACAVLVLEPPVYEVGTGYTATLRRTVQSPAFTARFGHPAWPETYRPGDSLHSVLPLGRRFTRPSPCRVRNLDRDDERCVAEAFNSSYQLFVLVYPESELRVRLAI
jgi:hypothetical protein